MKYLIELKKKKSLLLHEEVEFIKHMLVQTLSK